MSYHYSSGRFTPAQYSNLQPNKKSGLVDINAWNSSWVAPAAGPIMFYVGTACLRGLNDLIADLNRSRTGTGIVTPTAYAIRTSNYSFFGWENIDTSTPTTRIFAVPKSNEWKFNERELAEETKSFEHAHPLICAFIEGWLNSKYDEQGQRRR